MDGEHGSMSVSEQLRTYPSRNPKTVNLSQLGVDVGLGEGLVRSCSDTDIDPRTWGPCLEQSESKHNTKVI